MIERRPSPDSPRAIEAGARLDGAPPPDARRGGGGGIENLFFSTPGHDAAYGGMTEDAPSARRGGGLRHGNRRGVLRELVLRGPQSRAVLAGKLGLTGAALSRVTRELLDAGLVRELPEETRAGPGRRLVPLDLAPEGGYVLGIGVTSILQTVTLADLKNRTLARMDLTLDPVTDADAVIIRLARESRRLIDAHVTDRRLLLGGFLMISGRVDSGRGAVRHSSYMGEGWNDVPLRERFADLLDLPMRIEALPAATGLAEVRFGAARGWNDALVFICGLGLGARLILNGRLVEERGSSASEIGRVPATGADGATAALDRLASGFAVLRQLGDESAGLRLPHGRERVERLFAAIERDRKGDPSVAAAMAAAGRELGRAVARFALFTAPEVVVIAGPLSTAPRYLAAARETIAGEMGATPLDVVAGTVTGHISGLSATCALAVCEYLFERDPDFQGADTPAP